jgi:hypothetical protein
VYSYLEPSYPGQWQSGYPQTWALSTGALYDFKTHLITSPK